MTLSCFYKTGTAHDSSARMLANEFTTLTWTTLLKSMLGIADYLLHDPITTTNPSLSDEIAEPLLRSLLEIWLRSKNMDVELWRLLTLAFRRWKHRVEAVSHWSAVVLALTQRIVHVIKHGADTLASSKTAASEPSIIIVLPGSASIVIPLPIEYSVFAWYQMLYLLGSVQDESLTSAGFAAALKGISSIVDTILMLSSSAIDTTLSSIASPIVDAPVAGGGVGGLSVIAEAPSAMYQLQTSFDMQGSSIGSLADGNTLLRMVGPWLFDAVFVTPPASMVNAAFEEGRALAVSALCRIFAMRQARQPISPNFLAQFHRAMSHVLRQAAMAPSDKTGERWSSFERSVSSAALLGLRNVWLTVHDVAPRQSKSGGDNAPAGATCGLLRGLRQLAPWIIIVIRDLLLSTSQLPTFKATKRMVEQRFYAVKFLSAIVVQWHHFASLPLSEDLRVLLSKGMTTSQILGQYIEQQRDIRGDARVVSEVGPPRRISPALHLNTPSLSSPALGLHLGFRNNGGYTGERPHKFL